VNKDDHKTITSLTNVRDLTIANRARRSRHSQARKDPRRHRFLFRDIDLWPFDSKINMFPELMVEHFFAKFGDPSYVGFWDIMRINRPTHRQTPLKTVPSPLPSTALSVVCCHA